MDQTLWTSQDEAHRKEFARLTADCADTPLVQLAFQMEVAEYPSLLLAPYVDQFVAIANAVRDKLPEDATDGDKISALNTHLFDDMALRGDDVDYHNPDNSYLQSVLKRRRGLPISLSIVYLDVAERLQLSMVGVGLPGHFIVRYAGENAASQIFVDPFHEGRVLSKPECIELVHRLSGGRLPWHEDYLRGVDNKYILTRMLNNLKGCYARLADGRRSLRIQNYLLTLHPTAAHEVRDRGLLLKDLDSYRGALRDLTHYLELAPNAPDADRVGDHIFELRQQVSALQ